MIKFPKVLYHHFEHRILSGTAFGYGNFIFCISLTNLNSTMEKFRKIKLFPQQGIHNSGKLVEEIFEYLNGERKIFSLIPYCLWGTAFFRRVWCETRAIPYGNIISYSRLAHRIGKVSAVRAVGKALSANPIPLVIPCHRVIGKDGDLVGFGAGTQIKQKLLELENIFPPPLELLQNNK